MNRIITFSFLFFFFFSPFTSLSSAQENSELSSHQYGIFDTIADWGTEEFPPKLGDHKVPGFVDIVEEDGVLVYNLHGNGDDIWARADEGLFLYSEKSGSWRISAKVIWVHNGRESYSVYGNRPDAGIHIRSEAENSSSTNFRSYLRVGAFGPHHGNAITCWRDGEGEETRNWWNQTKDQQYVFEEGDGIYLRVTRIESMNYFFSEWSRDGENWNFGYDKFIEMPGVAAYGLSVTNTADNEMLALARFSDVTLEPSPPVAKRFVSSNSYKPNEIIPVMIRLMNTSGRIQKVRLIEPIPQAWLIIESDATTFDESSGLVWEMEMPPGQLDLHYTLQAPSEYAGILRFLGTVNSVRVFGAAEIVDSIVPISSLREYLTWTTLLITAPLVMFMLHMTMFLFNPKLIENLYYSLFLLIIAYMTHVVSSETVSFSDMHYQWQKVTFFASLSLGMLMLFLYTLTYNKLPLQFWCFIGVTLVFSLSFSTDSAFQYMAIYNLFYSIGVIECFRIVIFGIRQRKQGFSILAAGIFVYGFSWFWIYMNFFLNVTSPSIYIIPISTLFMMFCMSIYLSYWFMRLYKNLEHLTGELEGRVQQRTQELVNTNRELESTVTDLAKARDEAEAANQAKSQFLARMSHELRTPLTGLLGMNEILLNTKMNATQSHYLQSSIRAGESLLHVINEILDFSKIDSDKIELESVPTNLFEILQGVYDSLRSLANQKRLDLRFEYPSQSAKWVMSDPNRIRQIFMNLVGNAIKFTDKGHVSLLVIPKQAEEGKIDIRFEVQDTGVGIQPEAKEKIFDSFAQADETTTRKFGGTGLGLAITKRLIEIMGGSIEVKSEPGEGSTFSVSLGFVKAEEPQHLQFVSEINTEVLERKKVLLAEDDSIVSRVSLEMLDRAGCDCVRVANGLDAVKQFTKEEFDLILMDYHMPEMDGLDAVQRIREIESVGNTSRIPIIAVTANVDKQYRDECISAGMDDLLCKPFKMHELMIMLEKWLWKTGHETLSGKTEKQILSSSKSQNNDFPVLDVDVFNGIRAFEKEQEGLLQEVVSNYQNDAKKTFSVLDVAIENENVGDIHFHAHKFKSGSAVIGGMKVNQLCKEIELEEDMGIIKDKYNELRQEYERLIEAIHTEM